MKKYCVQRIRLFLSLLILVLSGNLRAESLFYTFDGVVTDFNSNNNAITLDNFNVELNVTEVKFIIEVDYDRDVSTSSTAESITHYFYSDLIYRRKIIEGMLDETNRSYNIVFPSLPDQGRMEAGSKVSISTNDVITDFWRVEDWYVGQQLRFTDMDIIPTGPQQGIPVFFHGEVTLTSISSTNPVDLPAGTFICCEQQTDAGVAADLSNLRWRLISETEDISRIEMEQLLQDPNSEFYGWRFATKTEVETLLGSLVGSTSAYGSEAVDSIMWFLNAFGLSYDKWDAYYYGSSVGWQPTYGSEGDCGNNYPDGTYCSMEIFININGLDNSSMTHIRTGTMISGSIDHGHLLVQSQSSNTRCATTPIFFLLLTGIGGRLRKSKRPKSF